MKVLDIDRIYTYLFECPEHGIFASDLSGLLKDRPETVDCLNKDCSLKAGTCGF